MKKLAFLAIVAFLIISSTMCRDSDDDDNNDHDDSDDDDDDDSPDDDSDNDDDDATSDDDSIPDDDDDDEQSAPVLSNGYFDPAQSQIVEIDEIQYYASTLRFSVCDADNDLLGGKIVFMQQGITTPGAEREYLWDDINNPPEVDLTEVGDCENPLEIGLQFLLDWVESPSYSGQICFDAQATDSLNNFSNTLFDICVEHNPT